VHSQAQQILADPGHQSEKFLSAFMSEPYPRMVEDPCLVLKGLWIAGLFMGGVFVFLNDKLTGGVVKRGMTFGLVAWALIIPWFEFYLPYNVMREPQPLVLFECFLWLGAMLTIGLGMSVILNFRRNGQ
jgi:hypothetical protein